MCLGASGAGASTSSVRSARASARSSSPPRHGRLRVHIRMFLPVYSPFLGLAHSALQSLHRAIPAFSPFVPVGLLPYLAFILLTATFGLAFYFSTSAPSLSHPQQQLMLPQVAQGDTARPRGRSRVDRKRPRWLRCRRSLLFSRCLRIDRTRNIPSRAQGVTLVSERRSSLTREAVGLNLFEMSLGFCMIACRKRCMETRSCRKLDFGERFEQTKMGAVALQGGSSPPAISGQVTCPTALPPRSHSTIPSSFYTACPYQHGIKRRSIARSLGPICTGPSFAGGSIAPCVAFDHVCAGANVLRTRFGKFLPVT